MYEKIWRGLLKVVQSLKIAVDIDVIFFSDLLVCENIY